MWLTVETFRFESVVWFPLEKCRVVVSKHILNGNLTCKYLLTYVTK